MEIKHNMRRRRNQLGDRLNHQAIRAVNWSLHHVYHHKPLTISAFLCLLTYKKTHLLVFMCRQ